MTACVSIPTFRRPKSRQKGSAHWTGQLVSPFVQDIALRQYPSVGQTLSPITSHLLQGVKQLGRHWKCRTQKVSPFSLQKMVIACALYGAEYF